MMNTTKEGQKTAAPERPAMSRDLQRKENFMPQIKTVHGMENRKVVSQKEWLVARKKFLIEEKKFSKLRGKLNLQPRKLPWVKIEKEYVFDGPTGRVTLSDLFSGKSQLVIYHFMFGPGWGRSEEHTSE